MFGPTRHSGRNKFTLDPLCFFRPFFRPLTPKTRIDPPPISPKNGKSGVPRSMEGGFWGWPFYPLMVLAPLQGPVAVGEIFIKKNKKNHGTHVVSHKIKKKWCGVTPTCHFPPSSSPPLPISLLTMALGFWGHDLKKPRPASPPFPRSTPWFPARPPPPPHRSPCPGPSHR